VKQFHRLTQSPVIDDERAKFDPVMAQAELYGCPTKYLYLTAPEHCGLANYAMHPFKDLQLKHLNNKVETLLAKDQFAKIPDLLTGLFESRGDLIVINSYPDVSEGMYLLWHLVCEASALRLKGKQTSGFSFNYVGLMQSWDETYQTARKHVLAYGPVVDEVEKRGVVAAVEFFVRFSDFTRVLVASSKDLSELLLKLRIAPSSVSYYLNLSRRDEASKKPRRKKSVEL